MQTDEPLETTMLIPEQTPLQGKLTSEFTPQFFLNRKSLVFHLQTLETKLFPQ